MIKIIIVMFSCLDLLLSYLYLKQFIRMFPNLNYTQLEANPIIKFLLLKYKFPKGMYLAIPLVILAWIVIVNLAEYRWLYFSLGLLGMMVIYHFVNFNQLKTLEKTKLSVKDNKEKNIIVSQKVRNAKGGKNE